ncbi:unnamed protein product [Rotaria sordida]|uniref:Homeobox domain-containing protein n=1 Tax=Rotaria sordida TaxID=392033 RepID=A0A815EKW9_9BILA|nr:unnamed protein product [Rotaria sordida]CAF1580481.1 unnamed protein product [Rotaria sordida]CAF3632774.1 unnamed protein product [Rotaria sordida]
MSSTSSSDDDNDENRLDSNDIQLLAVQKSLIYKHPLFRVLVYVLERCEQATLNPSLLLNNDDSYQSSSSSSFEHNLKIFLSKNPDILTTSKHNNDETSTIIDNFYIDAMQVLRIHLLELDKVNDLCRDFCQRYIACLKVKLNANNIFTDDEDDEDEDFQANLDDNFESDEENDDDDEFIINDKNILKEQHYVKQSLLNNGLNSICHPYTTQFNGQTPLSQIIASGPSHEVNKSSTLLDSFCTKRRQHSTIVSSPSSSSKRGVLPKSATSIMRSWLFQHIVHPYPTEDEKRAISQKTNLSLLQVNNWFINARRRILQPMLEASNPDLAANKKKKRYETTSDDHHHTHARQISNINRYWPSNLAQFNTTTRNPREK